MTAETYSVAILVVGSLYWQKENVRDSWRKGRLNLEYKEHVYAPIRYGRKSSSWGQTYTMVFSQLCYRRDYGLGQAILIPCKFSIRNAEDLIQEATELWKAETKTLSNTAREISRDWAAVGLLINPGSTINDEIIHDWKLHYQSQAETPRFHHSKTEKPSVDSNGMLNIQWLIKVFDDLPVSYDFILATAANPTLNDYRYPTAKEIAEAWLKADKSHMDYFIKNLENEITTFQDERIRRYLTLF